MKKHQVFMLILSSFLVGCRSPNPNSLDILVKWVIPGAVYTTYSTVKTSMMEHDYAAPGITFPEFEAAIQKLESIDRVPGILDGSPTFAKDHTYVFKYEGRKAVYYGRFIRKPENPVSRFLFSTGEITNIASFVAELRSTNPVSCYLLSRFSENGRRAIGEFSTSCTNDAAFDRVLVAELNPIVLGPSIYEVNRFHDVPLGRETHTVLKFEQDTRPETRLRREQLQVGLNRLLLVEAYPANLRMKHWNPLQNVLAVKY